MIPPWVVPWAVIAVVALILLSIAAHGIRKAYLLVRWRLNGRRRLGLPCDGTPLTGPEQDRLALIERGYARTAREPGRKR